MKKSILRGRGCCSWQLAAAKREESTLQSVFPCNMADDGGCHTATQLLDERKDCTPETGASAEAEGKSVACGDSDSVAASRESQSKVASAGVGSDASCPDSSSESLRDIFHAAWAVLTEPDPDRKADLTVQAWTEFAEGHLPVLAAAGTVPAAVASPARPSFVEEFAPGKVKQRSSRKALIHSLVHAESYAIDLAWDVVLRFGRPGPSNSLPYPKDFYVDFVKVAYDEAVHYSRWKARLEEIGGHYGCMPAHCGLWNAASATSGSLEERLVLVNCIHEARGLDTAPIAVRKFTKSQDAASVAILQKNVKDEVTHVAAGVKWLVHVCGGVDAAQNRFQELGRLLFRGHLKGPFDEASRAAAGLTPDWYMPLVASEPAEPVQPHK